MSKVNANKIIAWLHENGHGEVTEILNIPESTSERAAWNIDSDVSEILQAYSCPLFPATPYALSADDWDGVISAAESELGSADKLVKILKGFPKKTGNIPTFLRTKITGACKELQIRDPASQGGSQDAPSSNSSPVSVQEAKQEAKEMMMSPSTKRSSEGDCGTGPSPKKMKSTIAKPCLSTSEVWSKHREEVKSWWRKQLYSSLKAGMQKHRDDESADCEMPDDEVFDAIFEQSFLKLIARENAAKVVDWNFKSGRLEWHGKKQRTSFLKRIREALLRWSEDWAQ